MKITKEQVYDLYHNQNKTLNEISKPLGWSRQKLSRQMNKWGIEKRKSIDAMRLKRRQQKKSHGPNWKGGNWYSKAHDIWWTYSPNHPKSRHHGGVPTHILVAEERIGRPTSKNEVVHHLDENRSNNTPENLCVMTRSQHMLLHRVLGKVGIELIKNNLVEEVINAIREPTIMSFVKMVYVEKSSCMSNFTPLVGHTIASYSL